MFKCDNFAFIMHVMGCNAYFCMHSFICQLHQRLIFNLSTYLEGYHSLGPIHFNQGFFFFFALEYEVVLAANVGECS